MTWIWILGAVVGSAVWLRHTHPFKPPVRARLRIESDGGEPVVHVVPEDGSPELYLPVIDTLVECAAGEAAVATVRVYPNEIDLVDYHTDERVSCEGGDEGGVVVFPRLEFDAEAGERVYAFRHEASVRKPARLWLRYLR